MSAERARRWLITSKLAITLIGSISLVQLIGCGSEHQVAVETGQYLESASTDAPNPSSSLADSGKWSQHHLTAQNRSSGEASTSRQSAASETQNNPSPQRRIIYNSKLALVVKDYQSFEQALPDLVESLGGFVSKSETKRKFDRRQTGTWVVRVPALSYSEFMSGVTGLGFAESRREDARDVTEQYVDLQARIRNQQRLESRIVTMLEKHSGTLSDLLVIERELGRVREEIERMEGQLRMLADRTRFATVSIECREEQEYVPPKSPTFASELNDAFGQSLLALRRLGESLTILLAVCTPWAVTIGVPGIVIAKSIQRYRSTTAQSTTS